MRKFVHFDHEGVRNIENPCVCSFGIGEALAAIATTIWAGASAATAATSAAIAGAATDVGIGAETAATLGEVGTGAIEGAGIGAITDPKNPLKGAEFGAISGGVAAGASPFVADLGLGATATDAISGGIGGLAGGAATGKNLLTSGLEGAAAGGISGALSPSPVGSGSSAAPTSGGASAVSTAAPASVGAAPAPTSDISINPTSTNGVETVNVTGTNPGGPPLGAGPTAAVAATGGLSADPATKGQGGLSTAIQGSATGVPSVSGIGGPASGGGGISGWLSKNNWAVPAAGVALDALKGNEALPGQKQIEANAKSLNAQGNDLQSYLRSGTLPPGLQAGVKQASEAAKASIRSMYAASGQSGSSAEQQDLAAVDQRAQAQGSQIALNLLQQGVSEEGMANQLYMELIGNALQQDQQLGSAIASFSSALVPGTTTPKPAAA